MKTQHRALYRCILAVFALSLLSVLFLVPGRASWATEAENQGQEEAAEAREQVQPGAGRTVRVAFPEIPGLSQTDQYGQRRGVVEDYLQEIAKYTGWNYEYITADAETLLQEFTEGRFDLMGATYYQKDWEQYFGYPEFNCGYAKSVLLTRRDDKSIREYDWKSMNGKTIGVNANAAENIRRLEVFLQTNDLQCQLIRFEYEDLKQKNLVCRLEQGEMDMLLGNSADMRAEFRAVASFDAQPHYIVTTPGNEEILAGLNMAMEKIVQTDPGFAQKSYEANFMQQNSLSIYLTEEELAYIRDKQVVTVSVLEDWHPVFCMELGGDLHQGIAPDVLDRVSAYTGLKFSYVYAQSYEEALQMARDGTVDLLGAFLDPRSESAREGLALTSSYAPLNNTLVRNKSVGFPEDGLIGGVLAGCTMPAGIEVERVICYPSVEAALNAVNNGEADFYYGLASRIEQELQNQYYSNLVPNTLYNAVNELSFAMKRPADTPLMTILDKVINNLTPMEKSALVNQNMISAAVGRHSITEFIYENPVLFASVVTMVLLVLMVFWMSAVRARIRAEKMQISLERAEASSRAKGEFLSRMSHEIRTPMNAIVGLSDLTCRLENVPEGVKANLDKIRSASQYLQNLLSDILDVSRIEQGKLVVEKEAFSLGESLEELKSMLMADAVRRKLDFVVETEIRTDVVEGDSVRLKQVMTNLVSNAFKFTPERGQVLLRVVEQETREDGGVFLFQVIDNGSGISAQDQKRIFEAFEQAGSSSSRSQGTGLGLAISKSIVECMGGVLDLHSVPGEGSRFSFTITLQKGSLENRAEDSGLAELEGLRVLVAEDNDLNAEIAMELLKMQGIQVARAATGKEALKLFGAEKPGGFDAILMDIQMPEMDGLEACRRLRALPRKDARIIPVIAMTANSFQEDIQAAKDAGMDAFVTKPVDAAYLFRVLCEQMRRSRPEETRQSSGKTEK